MAMSRSRAGTSFTTRPSIARVPAVIVSSPAIMRRVVDLPQPDGPSSTMNSPSETVKLTSSTAGVAAPGKRLVTPSSLTTATRESSADGAGRHALDDPLGEEDVDHDHGDDRDHHASRDHAHVHELVPHELLEAQREGAPRVVGDEDDREEELVPEQDQVQDDRGDDGRHADGKRDAPEDLQ